MGGVKKIPTQFRALANALGKDQITRIFEVVVFRLGGLMALLVSSVIAARRLGPEKIGQTGMVVTAATGLALFVTLNGDAALIRRARLLGRAEKTGIVSSISRLRLKLAMVLATGWVVGGLFLNAGNLLLVGGAVYLLSLCMQPSWLLQAIDDVSGQIRMIAIQGALGVAGIVAFVKSESPTGVDCVVFACAALIACAYGWKRAIVSSRIRIQDLLASGRTAEGLGRYFEEAKWLFVSGVLIFVYTALEQPLIGLIVGVEALGVYRSSVQAMNAVVAFTSLVPMMLYPRLIDWAKKPDLWGKCVQLSRYVCLVSIAPLVAIELAVWFLYPVVFGEAYIGGRVSAVLLILAKFVVVWNVPYIWGIRASGADRAATKIIVLAAIVSLSLNLATIPFYGIVAAAIVNLTSEVLVLFVSQRVARRVLDGGGAKIQGVALF